MGDGRGRADGDTDAPENVPSRAEEGHTVSRTSSMMDRPRVCTDSWANGCLPGKNKERHSLKPDHRPSLAAEHSCVGGGSPSGPRGRGKRVQTGQTSVNLENTRLEGAREAPNKPVPEHLPTTAPDPLLPLKPRPPGPGLSPGFHGDSTGHSQDTGIQQPAVRPPLSRSAHPAIHSRPAPHTITRKSPKATRAADINWWQKKMDFSCLLGDL